MRWAWRGIYDVNERRTRLGNCGRAERIPCSIDQERVYGGLIELLTAIQKTQFDQEANANHIAAHLLDQPGRGGCGTSGSDHLVRAQHTLARGDCIAMRFE